MKISRCIGDLVWRFWGFWSTFRHLERFSLKNDNFPGCQGSTRSSMHLDIFILLVIYAYCCICYICSDGVPGYVGTKPLQSLKEHYTL